MPSKGVMLALLVEINKWCLKSTIPPNPKKIKTAEFLLFHICHVFQRKILIEIMALNTFFVSQTIFI